MSRINPQNKSTTNHHIVVIACGRLPPTAGHAGAWSRSRSPRRQAIPLMKNIPRRACATRLREFVKNQCGTAQARLR